MPSFTFTAVDIHGTRRSGVRDTTTPQAAFAELRTEGLFVLDVRAAAAARRFSGPQVAWAVKRDLLDITRTLSTLLPAGLSLPRALDTASTMGSGALAEVLAEVRGKVERGERLAVALRAYPQVFPAYYLGLVQAGERTGDLAGAFERLSEYLEREAQLRARLFSALLYPMILAIAGGAAMLVLLLFVLPNFAELLQDAGTQLPASTTVVLVVSSAVRRYWFVLPLLAFAAAATVARAHTTPKGRLAMARFTDRLPLAGPLLRDAAAARFARMTGTLLEGGAPLMGALKDASASIDSPLAHAAVLRVQLAVREGAALHRAIGREPVFPPLLAQITALGEESARLGEFLLKAATLFEERSERVVQRLVVLAEPALIVLFGGAVGFVALSLLQAIYSVNAGSFR